MRGPLLAISRGVLSVLPGPAAAQRDPCAGRLDTVMMVECLRPGGPVRGIRPSAAPAAAPATVPAQATAAPRAAPAPRPAESSVDLTVPFGFDSAEPTADGTAVLRALAAALKDSALAGARFRIVGHTDGQGSDDYNQALSERRAEAARRYLVERGGVDAGRLAAVGLGRRELYDPKNPLAAANRRVQVIRLDN